MNLISAKFINKTRSKFIPVIYDHSSLTKKVIIEAIIIFLRF